MGMLGGGDLIKLADGGWAIVEIKPREALEQGTAEPPKDSAGGKDEIEIKFLDTGRTGDDEEIAREGMDGDDRETKGARRGRRDDGRSRSPWEDRAKRRRTIGP